MASVSPVSSQLPRVSVLMPIYNQAHFVRRAVDSLLAQSLTDWELLIVDDGSTDDLRDALAAYLADPRVSLRRRARNHGLGAALNLALSNARAPLVAYLPADDVYYAGHLTSLAAALVADPEAMLAYSGVRHHYNRSTVGQVDGEPLQLVQVMHRRAPERWVEREELVSDDLERLYWGALRRHGQFIATGRVTCEWVDHPGQRHKVIREPLGGVNPYRVRYDVAHPLRFHSTAGNRIDEVAHYRRFRERPDTTPAPDGLTILLVGELAYNPERVLALEERGHRLYGLWMREPYWYNTVGPLPFGHVTDLPRADWRRAIRHLRPDVIYALLNWQTVPFAHEVLAATPGVPFVWHFKEGPFICLEQGTWRELLELYTRADGRIYISPEMCDWLATVVPGLAEAGPSLVLDGDLPKRDWFAVSSSPRLSETDGQIHTVVPGRPIGLHAQTVGELARLGIHLHFYGDFTQGQWRAWVEKARGLAPDHLHLHANVDQEDWVREFSQYDAGWLHCFASANGGEIRRATWDDLNYPARMATLAAAGLPMLQSDNTRAIVATQTLARELGLGLCFSSLEELVAQLHDSARMEAIRANVWRQRDHFTFDAHADELIAFFRRVIAGRGGERAPVPARAAGT
jgi:glycosyl transferase family 2